MADQDKNPVQNMQTNAADVEKNADNGWHDTERSKITSDDDACFKLWNVYIGEAERYDAALLEGWRKDMDGMLLFSALYSASLTAFIIESYKNLQADPQDVTVALLTQISQQLKGISTDAGIHGSFQPPLSSLICNMLWFVSLALALSCSLLATFVQQWTRDFIHKTTMRPSPVLSARVLAFSYLGLRRFGMHTFVDIIPILLHISLFFFFAGLIGFLQSVNAPLMYLMACVLFIFALVYASLTLIPLIYFDAPYRTPLSDMLWNLAAVMHNLLLRRPAFPIDITLTEAMIQKSQENPGDRDRLCMEYTIKSLDSDTELLMLLEAIPEAVCGPSGARLANWSLITSLMQSHIPEHNIIYRISSYIVTSDSFASFNTHNDRLIIVMKALWSLAFLLAQNPTAIPSPNQDHIRVFWLDQNLVTRLTESEKSLPSELGFSTLALVQTSRMQGLRTCVDMVANSLSMASTSGHTKLQMAQNAIKAVLPSDIFWPSHTFRTGFQDLQNLLLGPEAYNQLLSSSCAEELVEEAKKLVSVLQEPERWKAAQIFILGEYLSKARTLVLHHGLAAGEMSATINVIHSSMHHKYQHDFYESFLNVDEDEASYSFIIQQFADFQWNKHLDSIFLHSLRLFFSTKWALSIHESPQAAKCRNTVTVFCTRITQNPTWVIQRDVKGHIEASLIEDLHSHKNSASCLEGIFSFYLNFDRQSFVRTAGIPFRVYDFAKQFLKSIPTVSAELRDQQNFDYTLAVTEAVICRYILYNVTERDEPFSDLESIALLGEKLLLGIPTDVLAMQKAYLLSMNLTALSSLIQVCCKLEGSGSIPTELFWRLTDCFWESDLHYSGYMHEKSQVDFAEAIQMLVHSQSREQKGTASEQFFHHNAGVWSWSRHWPWITDARAANILIQAINTHRGGPKFEGMIFQEQDLLNRCITVAQGNESGRTSVPSEM
ncbi:hypothetical protein GYMLUDRAFT_190195 [Collybiopsis luxurians FD-317 M1]|nr:hypothetical protein GYMLUDRAFT_190195 [Collybiopsis luxurians FD-317 M1]